MIRIPVESGTAFTLNATSQGCADAGLCYPPQEHSARLAASGGAPQGLPIGANAEPASSLVLSSTPMSEAPAQPVAAPTPPQPAATTASAPSELAGIDAILQGGRLLAIVPAFALLGLGLAFTPCVLPMVPILSSIIVGEGGKTKRSRGLILSVTYSLGMAIVYTALGVAAGLIGEGLAAALQNPWVLGAFALLIVAMALSMFGFYELQVPAALQSKLAGASNRQASGKLAGVFVMGAISALIVGPCVAAPLAGALVYISQTRDVLIGGAALFSMAVGMSIPLLLVGVSAGSLLPRAGAWMESVKRFFGVLMLGMALWLVSPVLPPLLQMVLWAVLLLGYGVYLLRRRGHWAAMAIGAAFGILGALQLVGAATGGRDPLGAAGAPDWRAEARADLQARQNRGRAGRGARRKQRQDGHARFLCRLVRLVQGDGKADLRRSGRAGHAGQYRAAAGGRDGQRCRRQGDAQALRPVRAAGDHFLRPQRSGDPGQPGDRLPERRRNF